MNRALVASLARVRWFRRSRGLDLRPASEGYEKFMRENPNAEELLADAAEYFKQRELEYEREQEVPAPSGRVLGTGLGEPLEPLPMGSLICGFPLGRNRICTQKVNASTKTCAAGHTPRYLRA